MNYVEGETPPSHDVRQTSGRLKEPFDLSLCSSCPDSHVPAKNPPRTLTGYSFVFEVCICEVPFLGKF